MRRLAIALAACAFAFPAAAAGPASIEPKALGERIAWADQSLFVLDVRTPEEYAAGHLPGAVNIPHGELAARIAELAGARERDVVVYCRTGVRSAAALEVLGKAGFKRLFQLKGDYTRWSEEKRPVVAVAVIWRVAADAVLVLHFAFIAFALLGGLLVWRWPRLAWLHLPAAAWAAGIAFFGGICPLTPLENRLRAAGGEAGNEGGFIESHLEAIIYPGWLTRGIQVALGAIVIAINFFAYARLLRRG